MEDLTERFIGYRNVILPNYLCVQNELYISLINKTGLGDGIAWSTALNANSECMTKVQDLELFQGEKLKYTIARYMLQELSKSEYLLRKYLLAGAKISEKLVNYLYYEYLLTTCVCYVEDLSGVKAQKTIMTKNSHIIADLAGLSVVGKNITADLTPTMEEISNGVSRAVKLSKDKEGNIKTVKMRNGISINEKVSITPLFILSSIAEFCRRLAGEYVVRATYCKDNGGIRTLDFTENRGILNKYYPSEPDFVNRAMERASTEMYRGYIRVPEFGVSKYDDSGVRALNLARIQKLDVLLETEYDTRFINVDMSVVLPTFLDTIRKLTANEDQISSLYEKVFNQRPTNPDGKVKDVIQQSGILSSWANSQYAIGTSTFLRELHLFMLNDPFTFLGYTGESTAEIGTSSVIVSSNPFDVGFI